MLNHGNFKAHIVHDAMEQFYTKKCIRNEKKKTFFFVKGETSDVSTIYI